MNEKETVEIFTLLAVVFSTASWIWFALILSKVSRLIKDENVQYKLRDAFLGISIVVALLIPVALIQQGIL